VTLLFVHGAGGSPLTWHLQSAHFKESIAIELPGHPTGSGYDSIEEYADHLERYIQDKPITEPIIIGHSMGGAIAIEYALCHPDLAGLCLVGTGARLRVRPEFLSLILDNYEEACKQIAAWSVSPSCDPIIIRRIVEEMLRIDSRVTHGDFLACDKFDRMNDVERIRCRTLIVCGTDDRMTPPKYSQYLHRKIRNSKMTLIQDAGHAVILEKSRAFNEALESFLD
jgi:pimeloyl-ACP methyl ester carboxylesterase